MDITQLKYFITVARTLNFSEAARRMGVTQPLISHHVNELEKQLGGKLFTRSRHKVTLTEAGERTIRYADIDYNGHMNNTNYPDMLCDFLPDVLQTRVTGFVLSYLHEGTFGHTLRILRTETEGGYLFRTVDADGTVCLEAFVRTEPR